MSDTSPGIRGQAAPEWQVSQWFSLEDGHSELHLESISAPVVYLYCFQSWCPGCHSHGFPTMAEVRQQVRPDDVSFVGIQTVFEGHEINTAEAGVASMTRHGLQDLPLGHDVDADGLLPSIMRTYRTAGTPWTVIIGPDRRVHFDGFQIDAATATTVIDGLLQLPTSGADDPTSIR